MEILRGKQNQKPGFKSPRPESQTAHVGFVLVQVKEEKRKGQKK
jgi:hypothetical protein